jgi:hypothetical protein
MAAFVLFQHVFPDFQQKTDAHCFSSVVSFLCSYTEGLACVSGLFFWSGVEAFWGEL